LADLDAMKAAFRRTREPRPSDAIENVRVRELIAKLIADGEVTQEEVDGGALRAQLRIHGERADLEGLGLLTRMPGWTPGLYTDPEVTNFHFNGGYVDRICYDRLAVDVGEVHTSKLLRDLNNSGQLNLEDQSMSGVVSSAWALGEPGAAGGLGEEFWVTSFRRNGFTFEGSPAEPPGVAVEAFRGSTEGSRYGMSWTTKVDVAHRFATAGTSGRSVGSVYVARIEPGFLLAYIHEGHDEYEWVVDPEGLSATNVGVY
jgi:hypothetical protein